MTITETSVYPASAITVRRHRSPSPFTTYNVREPLSSALSEEQYTRADPK